MVDSFEQYAEGVPAPFRPMFDRLHELILEVHPEADVVIQYQVPTYLVGKAKVFLGTWKQGVTLYTTDPKNVEEFRREHPKIKVNKASINFRADEELPEEDVRAVLERALAP
jgi:uncharacterized protein YdhG (YjbR/CyaY superfamily)